MGSVKRDRKTECEDKTLFLSRKDPSLTRQINHKASARPNHARLLCVLKSEQGGHVFDEMPSYTCEDLTIRIKPGDKI